MSERLPEGRDPQTTRPASVEVEDDVLAGHLHRRGAPAAPRTLTAAIVASAEETAPERRWRLTLAAWRPKMALAVSGLTLAIVAGLLYTSATPPPIGTNKGSPSPSIAPSPVAAGDIWDPAQRALTPPELLRILATNPTPGTVLIVDDQVAILDVVCTAASQCPRGTLVNAGVRVGAPTGGHLPFDDNSRIPGPLAVQVTTGPNLVFLGAVLSTGLRMEFRASDLAKRSATGGLFVVSGWLWRAGVLPCPSVITTPPPQPTSELGLPAPGYNICAGANYLTDHAPTFPLTRSPSDGIAVQDGALAAYAPDPGGARPSEGDFLVRSWGFYGEVLARLEPLPIPSSEAVLPTTEPTVAPSPSTAGGIVMSSDELVSRVLSGELAEGSIAIASIPADAVTDLWAPGVVHDCPQLCPTWHLSDGVRSITVVVSMHVPQPTTIVGVQAFVVTGGGIRALGPAVTGANGTAVGGGAALPSVDSLYAVHGWLRSGPPRRCPATQPSPRVPPRDTGVFGTPLTWGGCIGTWILPSSDVPWIPPSAFSGSGPGSDDLSMPAGTLHVQDGATSLLGAGIQPGEGVWLVRAAKTNPCASGRLCVLQREPKPAVGITWYELVGPIAAPSAAVSATGIVLTQAQLISSVTGGAVPIGSIVVARATIAPVIMPSFPPAEGTVAGKIGSIRVHWASDPSLTADDLHQIALRVRPDGELDYLGPVDVSREGADGSTYGLFVVDTAQGWHLVRRTECAVPLTPDICPLAPGDARTVTLGPVFVLKP